MTGFLLVSLQPSPTFRLVVKFVNKVRVLWYIMPVSFTLTGWAGFPSLTFLILVRFVVLCFISSVVLWLY